MLGCAPMQKPATPAKKRALSEALRRNLARRKAAARGEVDKTPPAATEMPQQDSPA